MSASLKLDEQISISGKRDVSPVMGPQNYDSQRHEGSSNEGKQVQNSLALKDGGMTLEDDVESMLSDQFNTSNESMFKVRGVGTGPQGNIG